MNLHWPGQVWGVLSSGTSPVSMFATNHAVACRRLSRAGMMACGAQAVGSQFVPGLSLSATTLED